MTSTVVTMAMKLIITLKKKIVLQKIMLVLVWWRHIAKGNQ